MSKVIMEKKWNAMNADWLVHRGKSCCVTYAKSILWTNKRFWKYMNVLIVKRRFMRNTMSRSGSICVGNIQRNTWKTVHIHALFATTHLPLRVNWTCILKHMHTWSVRFVTSILWILDTCSLTCESTQENGHSNALFVIRVSRQTDIFR